MFPPGDIMRSTPGAEELQADLIQIREELDDCYIKMSDHYGWFADVQDGNVFNPDKVVKCVKSQLSQVEAKVHKLESKKVDGLLISHIPPGIVYVRTSFLYISRICFFIFGLKFSHCFL